jgi:signal transduction histidine kinase
MLLSIFGKKQGCEKPMIDAFYMKRMLTNLIANARQAMPNEGKIAKNAYCKGDRALLSVEDTGDGIS